MVKALLAGCKSMTRRVLKPQPREWKAQVIDISKPMRDDDGVWGQVRTEWSSPSFDMSMGEPEREIWEPIRLPAYVGDRLWVRETWADVNTDSGPALAYRAGGLRFCEEDAYPVEYERYPGCSFCMWWGDLERGEPGHRWRSPIHMPRWASRLTLTVTDVRVQRLQDISCADAIAEGIRPAANSATIDCDTPDPRNAYRDLWDSLHGPGAWARNPWVAAISFNTHHGATDGT